MALVATDNKHYKNIADAIRGKIGKPDLLRPEEMADGVGEVYEKGKTDFGYKKSVSGSYLRIDDISPNEKNIDVKLTSGTVTDFSNTKLTVCGENIFNPSNLIYEHEWYEWTEKDGVYSGYSHGLFLKCQNDETAFVSDCFLPNTQYIFTFKGWVNGFTLDTGETKYAGITFRFIYTDGTNSVVSINTGTETDFTLISEAGKTVKRLCVTSYYYNVINYIKEPQLSVYIPDANTEYEPYTGAEHTVNADGVIGNVNAYYPITNMFTDNTGITINTEYYADSEKIIGELTDTIISLGGTLDV